MSLLLQASELHAGYGPIQVLHGVDFHVDDGEVVVVLGANGAGKTTTLRSISQMVRTSGTLTFGGANIAGRKPSEVARLGIAHVPQGRGTLTTLSVADNLLAGAYTRRDQVAVRADIERWYDAFPRLGERRAQLAGSLSGGEQQMLAIARALMSRPRLLLLDEPSLGLAPLIVADVFRRLAILARTEGVTMLVVEQNARTALELADRAYVLESGLVVASGSADQLRNDPAIQRAYLGY